MSLSLICNPKCILGESPIWDKKNNYLYFIDIKKPAIYRYCIANKILSFIDTPSEVGCIVLKEDGLLVAAMKNSISFVDFNASKFLPFTSIDNDLANNRPNDGKCDQNGRLWVASMDNNEIQSSGRLWMISNLFAPTIMDDNFVIGNGIDWSPDSKKMYFTDSLNRVIYVYDYDLKTGTISQKNIFAKVSNHLGFPDGLTVDSLGFVWSAHWDGWRVTRYHPNGIVDSVIKLPVPRPTSLAFGGNLFTNLFITTARGGLSAKQLENAPLSGGVFSLNTNVIGKKQNYFFI